MCVELSVCFSGNVMHCCALLTDCLVVFCRCWLSTLTRLSVESCRRNINQLYSAVYTEISPMALCTSQL